MNWRKFTVVSLFLTSVVLSPGNRAALGQANWDGSDSADYFTAGNWDTNAVPASGQNVDVGTIAYTNAPDYNGDNSGTPAGVFTIGSTLDGSFAMFGGTFAAGDLIVGKGAGTAGTLTITGGVMNISGRFNTSTVNGADANIVISDGEINVAATDSNAIRFAAEPGANSPSTNTTITMSGGTIKSGGRIQFGRSDSDIATNDNPFVTVNMSDGLMWASGVDGNGTMAFQGGKINLSGGILRGGDMSTRSGFDQTLDNGKNGGVDFTGGMVEIITDLSEEALYAVPPGVDPLTVTGVPLQRGQNRALGAASPLLTQQRFYTTLADHAIRVLMSTDPVSGKDRAQVFASVKGDFDLDGVVSASDYVLWRKTAGYTYIADPLDPAGSIVSYYGADGDGDGDVDQDDYNVWRSTFVMTTIGGPYGAGSGSALGTANVPEPTAGILILAAATMAVAPRYRRDRKN